MEEARTTVHDTGRKLTLPAKDHETENNAALLGLGVKFWPDTTQPDPVVERLNTKYW